MNGVAVDGNGGAGGDVFSKLRIDRAGGWGVYILMYDELGLNEMLSLPLLIHFRYWIGL